MGALTNTGQTVVTDRQAQGPIPDTSPPNGSNPGGGGGAGTVTSVTAGTGLTGGVITTAGTIALANTAVVPGSYSNADITVDAQGRITGASNGSSGGGGTVTSVAAGTGLTGGTITSSGTIALANTAVTPGAYTLANITVDQQGRITAASSGSAGAGTVTSITTGAGLAGGTITTSGTISLATIATGTILGNVSGGTAAPSATTPTSLLDNVFGNAQGNVLYRNATVWTALAPGTAGQFLKTNGAGANPAWASPSGSGTVTSVGISGANGIGVSGSPITGSGTIGLTLGDISSATSKPAITGSVVRSFAARAADVFNVKDFGATGNGSTDDTAACQAAMTAAAVAGGCVYFPGGIYKISSALTASLTNIVLTVRGDGSHLSVIRQATNASAHECFRITQTNRDDTAVEFIGISLIPLFAGAVSASSAIKVTNNVNHVSSGDCIVVSDVVVTSLPGYASCFSIGLELVNMWGSHIYNYRYIGDNNGHGIGVMVDDTPLPGGGNQHVLIDCFFSLCAQGLHAKGQPQGIFLIGCNMNGLGYGIYSDDEIVQLVVSGCYIDCGESCIHSTGTASGVDQGAIVGNDFYLLGGGGRFAIEGKFVRTQIVGNTFIGSEPANGANGPKLTSGSEAVLVTNNVFFNFNQKWVTLNSGCSLCRVNNNIGSNTIPANPYTDSGSNNQVMDFNWDAGSSKVRVIVAGVDVGGLTPV